jgi:hypothetical protein
MHLNSFAGRSYIDLTQYPVFPWVIADYEWNEIDLNNPNIYRDLALPMGALGLARAAQFRERYESLQSNYTRNDEPPPFHYGTHYSCAAYVLNYLLRLEPFSRLALSIQGGKFDLADRLFNDFGASWRSASRDNLQDVRELIPSRLERKPFPARLVIKPLKDAKCIDWSSLHVLETLCPPFCIVGASHAVHLRVVQNETCKVGMSGQHDSSVGDLCLIKGQLVGVEKDCVL